MKFNVIIDSEASSEIEDIADWYEFKSKGLGVKFYKEVKKNIRLLYSNANSFAIKYDDIRCIQTKRFPCLIHYKIINKTVVVYGVISTSRNPDIWKTIVK